MELLKVLPIYMAVKEFVISKFFQRMVSKIFKDEKN